MRDLILIDTNVLVYALDAADLTKQRRAIDLLDAIADRHQGTISVQCLTELFNAITRNIAGPLPPSQAADHVADFAAVFAVLELTSAAVIEACRAVSEMQMSIWDALIWAVASINNAQVILTEDMQHQSLIGDVRYYNPFHPEFELSTFLRANRDG